MRRDAEFLGNIGWGRLANGEAVANVADNGLGESGGMMTFAIDLATLGNHVGGVALLRSRKQVGRIDAWRIVAGVTNQHSIGDRADEQFVGDARCFLVVELTVSVPVACAFPQDAASVGYRANVSKEAIFNRLLGPSNAGQAAKRVATVFDFMMGNVEWFAASQAVTHNENCHLESSKFLVIVPVSL